MNIVGISGRDRSGKDTVAELFMEAGYFGFSFGDAVRRHSRVRHADKPDPISVTNMTETSNWLRTEYGADVILKEALKEFDEARQKGERYKGIVLYSVRAPIEADFIIEHGGQLIWAETSDEVRYSRKINNLRDGEAKITIEEMLAQESLQAQPQAGIPTEVQMDLSYIKAHATKTIVNEDNDIEAFKQKIKQQFGLE